MCENLKNKYQLFEEIGGGRFGIVYCCFSPASDEFFACKTIDKRLLIDPTDRECIEKELKILQLLSGNPHILQIYKLYEDENYLSIITDLCESPDLYERIPKSTFTESESTVILKPLISTVAFCHHLGIAYRDIKPDNVLIDSRNRLKLVDFGSAEYLGGNERGSLRGVVGTSYYVAPEVLTGKEYKQ